MASLNVGCGVDRSCDIKLDISKAYHGEKTALNIIADAQNLPFKDQSLENVKASHVLEHLPKWLHALHEWCRVCRGTLEIIFPSDPGFLRKGIWMEILSFSFSKRYFRSIAILPQRRREHLWQFNPNVICRELGRHGFNCEVFHIRRPFIMILGYGRKGKLLAKLTQHIETTMSFRILGTRRSMNDDTTATNSASDCSKRIKPKNENVS